MEFESLYARPGGSTPRREFVPALLTLLAAVALFALLVKGRTGMWSVFVLLFPAFVLHARRLHDMGRSALLLLIPLALLLCAFAIWLGMTSLGERFDTMVPRAALGVAAAVTAWCCLGPSSRPVPPAPGSP